MKKSEELKQEAQQEESDFAYMAKMNKSMREARLERFEDGYTEKLEIIFNYYTQNELAIALGITQWKLLQKMQNDDFTQVEINDIDHIFEKEIKESKEYIHDVFMEKIKIPQDILDKSFESTKGKILKWIPDKK
jgi:hypothetical protein